METAAKENQTQTQNISKSQWETYFKKLFSIGCDTDIENRAIQQS